ncbi:MAG: GNAT family N-acetyltransferase [Bacteroidetes bacterium]|nr:GNAT family N-acetyltransferase [Bacteroidota bacterium]NCQ12030.1 GNAT family N-acetyltransferase [Bacteroidota bacterium]
MENSIQLFSFDELSKSDLYTFLKLRQEVFIVEQDCPYVDLDGIDDVCHHILIKVDDTLAAYSRILPPNLKFKDAAIGRIIVRKEFRGKSLGLDLIRFSIQECKRLFPDAEITISAQFALVGYYSQFGFVQISEPYDEDGIKHANMKLM